MGGGVETKEGLQQGDMLPDGDILGVSVNKDRVRGSVHPVLCYGEYALQNMDTSSLDPKNVGLIGFVDFLRRKDCFNKDQLKREHAETSAMRVGHYLLVEGGCSMKLFNFARANSEIPVQNSSSRVSNTTIEYEYFTPEGLRIYSAILFCFAAGLKWREWRDREKKSSYAFEGINLESHFSRAIAEAKKLLELKQEK